MNRGEGQTDADLVVPPRVQQDVLIRYPDRVGVGFDVDKSLFVLCTGSNSVCA